jgi:hypothetical protein
VASRRRLKRTESSKIDATPPWETRVREAPPPTTGPFDETDAPDDDVPRVDLGALRVPVGAGIDVRLEMNEAQQVTAVTLASPEGHMQLGVFAAPRNEGIWDDVRSEIASSMNAQRGGAKERHEGPWGVELIGKLPGEGGGGMVPVRFIGIDGPRWFLRAMLVGHVAADHAKGARFEKLLRQVVVVRGTEPLPVREAVPLRLPKDLAEQIASEQAEQAEQGGEPL